METAPGRKMSSPKAGSTDGTGGQVLVSMVEAKPSGEGFSDPGDSHDDSRDDSRGAFDLHDD